MPPRSRKPKPFEQRRFATPVQVEQANREGFHEMAHHQRACQGCGATGNYESHHVVEKAELRRRGRMDVVWDRRNCMRVCSACHRRHTIGFDRLKLQQLLDMHYEFAFEILGASAWSYLRRQYNGRDKRLDEYLERWEEEHGGT